MHWPKGILTGGMDIGGNATQDPRKKERNQKRPAAHNRRAGAAKGKVGTQKEDFAEASREVIGTPEQTSTTTSTACRSNCQ